MFNFIRRLLNRNNPNRGQFPEFFEVPYLRDEDVPSDVLLTPDLIRSICSVRIVDNYKNPQLRNVYFNACNSKGDIFHVIQYSNRTPGSKATCCQRHRRNEGLERRLSR